MKHAFAQITERYKKHRRRRDFAFHEVSETAEDLMDSVEDKKIFRDLEGALISKNKIIQIKRLARNNFVINMVTALEVGLKQIILEYSEWDEAGLSKLLAEQRVNLSEAYDLFGKHRVTREFMLCQTTSFQNLQAIERVFSHLTNTPKFLKVAEKAQFREESPDHLKAMIPHWYMVVKTAFEVRNNIVHEGKISQISWSDAEVIGDTFFWFYHAIYDTTLKLRLAAQEKNRETNPKVK